MTRQQYELNCEILQSLDNIDNCVMESETLVMDSMLNTYSKAVTVLEHCSDTADISSFNIIQESFILEDGEGETTNDGNKDTKKEKLIMKILLFIPRMIKKFIVFLKSKIGSGNTMKKLVKRIDELGKMSKSDKEKIIQLVRDNEEKIIQHGKDAGVTDRPIVINLPDAINIMNGNITTNLDFDKIKMVYDDIIKMFKVLEKYDFNKPSTLSEDIRQQMSLDKTVVDTSFDIRTKGGVPKLMKLSVLKKNIHDILDLDAELKQISQHVYDKLNEQVKAFNNNNGAILNENQQKKLDDSIMVTKYVKRQINVTEELISKISVDMNRVLDYFSAIERLRDIRPGSK